MLEDLERRIESMMTKLIEDIDRKYTRRMQGDMHKCAIKCCENETNTIQGVQRCISECAAPFENAHQFIQREFDRSKNRLDRCFEDCRDKMQDKVGPNSTQETIKKYRGEYENCAATCLDSYCNYLPQLEKSITDTLANKYSKI